MKHRDVFLEDMKRLGFEDPFLGDVYDKVLADGLEQKLDWRSDFGDDRMLYRLDIGIDNERLPYLAGFKATLIKTHPIEHGIFAGVDTGALEEQLKKGDWNTDMDVVSDLFGSILTLTTSKSEKANEIGERLQARYWLGTSLTNHLKLDRLLSRFGRSHYFLLAGKIGKVTAKQAYNLISGRPRLLMDFFAPALRPETWVGLKSKGGEFEEVIYDGCDIVSKLQQVNIKELKNERTGLQLLERFADGDLVPATLVRLGVEIPVCLSADPKGKCPVMVDADGRNLYIDRPLSRRDTAKEKVEKMPSSGRKKGNGTGI